MIELCSEAVLKMGTKLFQFVKRGRAGHWRSRGQRDNAQAMRASNFSAHSEAERIFLSWGYWVERNWEKQVGNDRRIRPYCSRSRFKRAVLNLCA